MPKKGVFFALFFCLAGNKDGNTCEGKRRGKKAGTGRTVKNKRLTDD